MIEEALLGKSQFLGRDGFRWWIGQIAPRDAQKKQNTDGEGWGNRYKVRIMGYHPFTEDLENDELPYALTLLPTTSGSGAANFSDSTKLQQGDVVFGFFLDGDQAQIPAIVGHFGKTQDGETLEEFSRPFEKYTGYTPQTPENPKIRNDQANEQNKKTQPTNSSAEKGKYVDQDGSGQGVLPADTCTTSSISKMAAVVEGLADRIEQFAFTGMNLQSEIEAVASLIEVQANSFVGRMFDVTYDMLVPLLQQGLQLLYKKVFGIVFAQCGGGPQCYALAHLAGVAAQTTMVEPVKNAENSIACLANKIVEGLYGTVKGILEDLLKNGLGYSGCIGANFVANFLNKIIDEIVKAMKPVLNSLKKILIPIPDLSSFLRSSASVLEDFSAFLDCNQSNKFKCSPEKKYTVGAGSAEKGADPFSYVMGKINKFGAGGSGSVSQIIDSLSDGGSCKGGKVNCGSPFVEIFGGGGIGAIGELVLGNFIENTPGLVPLVDGITKTASIIGVNVKVPGKGYKTPPTVNFTDKCKFGYGCHGRAIIDEEGQVTAILVDTPGENYPVLSDPPTNNVGVTGIYIIDPGEGYTPGDQIDEDVFVYQPEVTPDALTIQPEDPNRVFDVVVVDGRVVKVNVINIVRFETLPILTVKSKTGRGAVLRPIFGDIPPDIGQRGVFTVIDCVS